MKSSNLLLILILNAGFKVGGMARTWQVGAGTACPTIHEGIEQANPGDTLFIQPGIYREGNIEIAKKLAIQGIDWPVIDGENKTEILTITVDSVTIEGLRIQNVGTNYLKDQAGIRGVRVKHLLIRNNRLMNTFFGIYLEHCSDVIVAGNHIEGSAIDEVSSGNAIHAWYCKLIQIEANQVSGHRDGIYFEFVDSSQICENDSQQNLRYGLHFMFSNDDDYMQNRFELNGAGVAVMFSRRIVMRNNQFIENWGSASYGLLLKEIYDGWIYLNRFDQNTIGVYSEGSNRILFEENIIHRNGWGVKIAGGCADNLYRYNDFNLNTFDVTIPHNQPSITFQYNHWDQYQGYDLNHDGVGDVPFRPVKLYGYVVSRSPEAIVLLRSFLVDLLNYAEKVNPVATPLLVQDPTPLMHSKFKSPRP
ncbi:MAG: nitrous oxide reductase family maturation protein NosD [Saprospiraceae bacterium]|nr:nitrous oxide reductase family maturation protein NosD [Saprospiraceae bacterium]